MSLIVRGSLMKLANCRRDISNDGMRWSATQRLHLGFEPREADAGSRIATEAETSPLPKMPVAAPRDTQRPLAGEAILPRAFLRVFHAVVGPRHEHHRLGAGIGAAVEPDQFKVVANAA